MSGKTNKLADALGGAFLMLLIFAWGFGGLIGAIYWAVKDSLINVVLSIFIPGYGILSTIGNLLFGR